jgi:hypothetical protein
MMHGMNQQELADSIRIFQWELEAGRPLDGMKEVIGSIPIRSTNN